jgi:hypothetical protein
MKKRDLFGRRFPPPILNRRAPFWNGSTAEDILAQRLIEREHEAQQKASKRRANRRSTSRTSKPSVEGPPDLIKRLRRLERNVQRRKTLAARQRLEIEIRELKAQLDL